MAPRKSKPPPSDAAPPVYAKTTKAISSKIQKLCPTTSKPRAKKVFVPKYRNDLLNLEQTSILSCRHVSWCVAYQSARILIAVWASWNSTTSPLLRLPADLGDKIWRYALGGQVAMLRVGERKGGPVVFEVCDIKAADCVAMVLTQDRQFRHNTERRHRLYACYAHPAKFTTRLFSCCENTTPSASTTYGFSRSSCCRSRETPSRRFSLCWNLLRSMSVTQIHVPITMSTSQI